MRFYTNGCGWYFEYTDKNGVLRTFGPWLSEQDAREEARYHES